MRATDYRARLMVAALVLVAVAAGCGSDTQRHRQTVEEWST